MAVFPKTATLRNRMTEPRFAIQDPHRGCNPAVFTKATGLFIVPLWLAAMGWLVAHDVWPRLTALDPPRLRPADWLENAGDKAQFAIYSGKTPMGTIWTNYLVDEDAIRRDDLIWIDHLPVDIAPLRITVSSVFTAKGVLDEFTLRIDSPSTTVPLELHGERFHADFSFTLDPGEKTFRIPLTDAGLIAGGLNPFGDLSDLAVGRSWRMQVFNPVAALTGIGERFMPMLVTVTGEQRLHMKGWEGNCLILESGWAKAWVDAHGVVRRQEITLPMVGTIQILRLPYYDLEARNRALSAKLLPRRG